MQYTSSHTHQLFPWNTSLTLTHLAGLDDLSGLPRVNSDLATVEVLHHERRAGQRLDERDLLLHQEVHAVATEVGMLLHLEDNDDIAGLLVGLHTTTRHGAHGTKSIASHATIRPDIRLLLLDTGADTSGLSFFNNGQTSSQLNSDRVLLHLEATTTPSMRLECPRFVCL